MSDICVVCGEAIRPVEGFPALWESVQSHPIQGHTQGHTPIKHSGLMPSSERIERIRQMEWIEPYEESPGPAIAFVLRMYDEALRVNVGLIAENTQLKRDANAKARQEVG